MQAVGLAFCDRFWICPITTRWGNFKSFPNVTPKKKFLKTVKKSQGLVKEHPLSMGRCNFMIFFIVIEISHKKASDLKKKKF